jgi:hypothetical protein
VRDVRKRGVEQAEARKGTVQAKYGCRILNMPQSLFGLSLSICKVWGLEFHL